MADSTQRRNALESQLAANTAAIQELKAALSDLEDAQDSLGQAMTGDFSSLEIVTKRNRGNRANTQKGHWEDVKGDLSTAKGKMEDAREDIQSAISAKEAQNESISAQLRQLSE